MTDVTHVHLGEDADAYALGALDDVSRARVDASAASCDACAARLGEAEGTVARLVVPVDVPARSVPRANRAWLAIAAAFLIGLLPSAYLVQRANDEANTRALALTALVHSHFLHAPFVSLASGVPSAKLIYARDSSWAYVVLAAPQALTVVAEPGDRILGTLAPSGDAAALFVEHPQARSIELREGQRRLAKVDVFWTP